VRRKRLARRAGCRYLWGLNADPLVTVLGKPELAEGANALSAFAGVPSMFDSSKVKVLFTT